MVSLPVWLDAMVVGWIHQNLRREALVSKKLKSGANQLSYKCEVSGTWQDAEQNTSNLHLSTCGDVFFCQKLNIVAYNFFDL